MVKAKHIISMVVFFWLQFSVFAQSHWGVGHQIALEDGVVTLKEKIGAGSLKTVWKAEFLRKNGKKEIVALQEMDTRITSLSTGNSIVDSAYKANQRALAIANEGNSRFFALRSLHLTTSPIDGNAPVFFMIYDLAQGDASEYLKRLVVSNNQSTTEATQKISQMIEFGEEVSKLLEVLRKNGVSHGDIRFENLLVTKSGLKLADLDGLSEIGDISLMGTPMYRSPEVQVFKLGSLLTSASDEFSNGAMLFELLAKKTPVEIQIEEIERILPELKEGDPLKEFFKIKKREINPANCYTFSVVHPDHPYSFKNTTTRYLNNLEADYRQAFGAHPEQWNEFKKNLDVLRSDITSRLELDPKFRKFPGLQPERQSLKMALRKLDFKNLIRKLCLLPNLSFAR